MSAFTLVRHSRYAVAADAAFESRVEVCEITAHQVYLVRATGGIVYPTRDAANAAETTANATTTVMTQGYFSSLRIAGAEIHIPHSVAAKP